MRSKIILLENIVPIDNFGVFVQALAKQNGVEDADQSFG